ncbi:unnamed protein product [Strongylus vulgaris]|uniref:Uncharacterized protein n=1 Tax=Strongylus vulgaris TaxID=40348 RepID=A0A3P7JE14_STRVU|nr:unnamed protein product [Strongylus vulgaris]
MDNVKVSEKHTVEITGAGKEAAAKVREGADKVGETAREAQDYSSEKLRDGKQTVQQKVNLEIFSSYSYLMFVKLTPSWLYFSIVGSLPF